MLTITRHVGGAIVHEVHMHSFGRFVKGVLVAHGVSQTEIARRAGEDVKTVNHVLAGKRTNRAEPILIEIAKATNLRLGDLRSGLTQERAA